MKWNEENDWHYNYMANCALNYLYSVCKNKNIN